MSPRSPASERAPQGGPARPPETSPRTQEGVPGVKPGFAQPTGEGRGGCLQPRSSVLPSVRVCLSKSLSGRSPRAASPKAGRDLAHQLGPRGVARRQQAAVRGGALSSQTRGGGAPVTSGSSVTTDGRGASSRDTGVYWDRQEGHFKGEVVGVPDASRSVCPSPKRGEQDTARRGDRAPRTAGKLTLPPSFPQDGGTVGRSPEPAGCPAPRPVATPLRPARSRAWMPACPGTGPPTA